MWNTVVGPDRPQMTIWHMRIACWIPKATDTRLKYVIQGYSKWLSGYNFPAAISHQIRETKHHLTIPFEGSMYSFKRRGLYSYVSRNWRYESEPPLKPSPLIWLQTVWIELDYRVDVCRITKGAHTENL